MATEDTRHDVVSVPLGSPAWVRSVQRRYDPGNVFRLNHNIDPAG